MQNRFLGADTLVPDPLNPQDLNRYSYVRNSLPNYIDLTGYCSWNPFEFRSPDSCYNWNNWGSWRDWFRDPVRSNLS